MNSINENDIIYYNVKEFFSTIRYMIDKGGSVVIKNNFIHKNYLANENDEKSILEKYTHIDKLNRHIIDEFISKILIGKKDENNNRPIKIFWNFTI